jgi:uncharacterized protein YjiS (DUF1127 family)
VILEEGLTGEKPVTAETAPWHTPERELAARRLRAQAIGRQIHGFVAALRAAATPVLRWIAGTAGAGRSARELAALDARLLRDIGLRRAPLGGFGLY